MVVNKKRLAYVSVTVAVLVATLLTACAPPATPVPEEIATPTRVPEEAPTAAPQETPPPEEQIEEGGSVTYVVGQNLELLDPNRFRGRTFDLYAIINIYDRLIAKDPETGEFFGNLAHSWEVSDDDTTYTFHLKEGVTFHDGTPFNADAVKYNVERIRDPEHASALVSILVDAVEEVNVLDDYTVEFQLSTPYGPLMDNLSDPKLSIVSPAAAEEYGEELARHPVGTGPFIFKEWLEDEYVLLEKNPDYNWAPAFFDHQGPAYLDEVKIVMITEEAVRFAAFEAGEIDILYYPPLREVPRFQADPDYTVKFNGRPGIPRIVTLNMEHWPLDDLKVRQAIAYAINAEEIHEVVFEGVGAPTHSLLCPGTFGHSEAIEAAWPRYDPERARALFEEAGFTLNADGILEKDGETFSVSYPTPAGPLFVHLAEVLVYQLRDVGIDASVELMEIGAYLEGCTQGTHTIAGLLIPGTDGDVLWQIAHSSQARVAFNVAVYLKPEVDELLEQARYMADQEERLAIYERIQEIMMEDMPYVPFLCQQDVNIFRSNLVGLKHDPLVPPLFYDVHYTH